MRRWWVWLLIGLAGLFLLANVAFFLFRAKLRSDGQRELAEVVAHVEATDPGWRWDDIMAARPAVDPHSNSAELAAAYETDPKFRSTMAAWGEEAPYRDYATLLGDRSEEPSNWRAREEWLCESEMAAEDIGERLELAREIARRPHFRPKLELTDDYISMTLSHIQGLRNAVALLQFEGLRSLEFGRPDVAMANLNASLDIARACREGMSLIDHLVHLAVLQVSVKTAEQLVGRAEWGDRELKALQERFRMAGDTTPGLRSCLRGERAGMDHLMSNLIAGKVSMADLGGMVGSASLEARLGEFVIRPTLPHNQAEILRFYTSLVEVTELPPHERAAAVGQIPLPPRSWTNVLAGLLLPATEKVIDANSRATARLACAEVAIACERFRLREGRWPASMDEVPLGLLSRVPTDPYDGEPVRFHRAEDGVIIHASTYTPDAEPEALTDAFGKSRLTEGANFRLWDVDARGVEPPELPEEDDLDPDFFFDDDEFPDQWQDEPATP